MPRRLKGLAATVGLGAIASCAHFNSSSIPRPTFWYLPSASALGAGDTTATPEGVFGLIDTTSLRPVLLRRGAPTTGRIALFTSFEGTRYHPEAVRAIAEDSSVLAPFGRAVASVASSAGDGLLLDFQDLSSGDLPQLVELVRSIATASHAQGRSPVGIIVPAADTLGYPAPLLARVADVIVIRFGREHRPGTAPGPLVTPDFLRRELGMRMNGLGATRLAVEIPLYGYVWSRDGTARVITYAEANALVLGEAGTFRRDPTSQFLTASGRDGWTIWVPDARTIQALTDVAQTRGVNTIALSGTRGADPVVLRADFLRR